MECPPEDTLREKHVLKLKTKLGKAREKTENPKPDNIEMTTSSESSKLVDNESSNSRGRILNDYIRPVAAEFFGTSLYVIIGILSIHSTHGHHNEIIGSALGHGLALALLIAAFGQISGGHFNPAVTLGVLLGGGMTVLESIVFQVSQILGAILGASVAMGILHFETGGITAVNHPSAFVQIAGGGHQLESGVHVAQGVLCECVLTCFLVQSMLMTMLDSDGTNILAPFAVGLTVTMDIVAGGRITGASMNPARSLASAVLYQAVKADSDVDIWTNHWVYWLGPLLGSCMAALLYRLLFIRPERRGFLKTLPLK